MDTIIFGDKSVVPDAVMLVGVLGNSANYYAEIVSYIENTYGSLSLEWKFYGKNSGWTMKMLNGKRNVMFLIPREGYFRLAFTFGEKAFAEVMASSVPQTVKDELAGAVKYAEGRGVQLPVNTLDDLFAAKTLVDIKIAN